MTWTAFYEPDHMVLNLSEADLGHPDHPNLWEHLHGDKPPRGAVRCMGCSPLGDGGGCEKNPDGAMFLRQQGSRRQAVHYPAEIRRPRMGPEETDVHKALKEYIATSAERHGFRADIEHASPSRRRRADVTIEKADGAELRVEAQVSGIHPSTVAKRDALDRADGAVPMWVTREVALAGRLAPPSWVDRSPWALIRQVPREDIVAGAGLDVRGGVKELVFERCGTRSNLCPERNRALGRGSAPCGREHGHFDPKRAVVLGELVGEMAAGEMVDIQVPRGRSRVNHHLVTAEDAAQWRLFRESIEPVESESAEVIIEEFNQLDPRYDCDPRPWGGGAPKVARLDPSVAIYSGITRDLAPDDRCLKVGCERPGSLVRCQLCPHSPTYWRKGAVLHRTQHSASPDRASGGVERHLVE